MKHKGLRFCFWIFIASWLLSTPVFAQEVDQTEELRSFSGADSLLDLLPEEVDRESAQMFLEEKSVSGLFRRISEQFFSVFSLSLRESLGFFCGMLSIIIMGAVWSALKQSLSQNALQSAFDLLFLLILATYSYSALQQSFTLACQSLQSTNSFVLASLPITTVLLSMGGGLQAGAVQATNLSFVLSLVSILVSGYLLPILRTLFALSLVGSFTDTGLGSLISFFKRTVKVLCVFFFTVVSGILALQNALAVASDSLAMRSVRFASGNFIPVIGSLVGEASKTLAASLKVVRTECGILCLCILLFLLLRPVLCIVVQKIFLSLAAAVGELLGEKKSQGLIKSLGEILDLMMALLLSEGCYLIFYITLFLNNKGSF